MTNQNREILKGKEITKSVGVGCYYIGSSSPEGFFEGVLVLQNKSRAYVATFPVGISLEDRGVKGRRSVSGPMIDVNGGSQIPKKSYITLFRLKE